MTPADKRLSELLDKWLASLDLHLRYVDLSDAAYADVQPWPKHDRPTRWIVELAKQKTLELKEEHQARIAMGDGKFAEALELMSFLANLVGSQHIQRFIPLAEPERERKPAAGKIPADTAVTAVPPSGRVRAERPDRDAGTADTTREMPRLPASSRKAVEPPQAARQAPPHRPATKSTKKAAPAAAAGKPATGSAMQKKVMADAVRLLKWGREWHELADLIARIAERPPAAEIRRILRSHKAEIEMQAESDE